MPRQARKRSSSGIYHIMLRGINRQIIFEDREDYQRFFDTLKKYENLNAEKSIQCYISYGPCFGNEVTCLCYVVKVTGWCYSYMYVY